MIVQSGIRKTRQYDICASHDSGIRSMCRGCALHEDEILICILHICRQRRIIYGCNGFKACLFLASVSEKLLRLKINKWSAERKFGFEETVNFQAPRPPANIRPKRIEQAGGSRKNFAAPASKKARPRAGFCGGPAPHTVKPVRRDQPL